MELKEKQVYQILSKQNRFAIAVEKASTENGALIKLAADTGDASQQWEVQFVEGAWFKLVNKNSGKLLDMVSSGVENGTWLHQWEEVNSPDQLWCVEEGTDGCSLLKSKKIWPLC